VLLSSPAPALPLKAPFKVLPTTGVAVLGPVMTNDVKSNRSYRAIIYIVRTVFFLTWQMLLPQGQMVEQHWPAVAPVDVK